MSVNCGSGDTVERGGAGRGALRGAALLLLAGLGAAGCSYLPEGEPDTVYRDPDERRRAAEGSIFDIFGVDQIAGVEVGTGRSAPLTGTEVNRYLWRASIDTLAFLPVASTDPFSGLVATDWGQPSGSPDERFRATAYVTSTELSPDSLRVAVFRQVREEGQWVAAPVEPGVVRQIEDAILVRARQLRIAERAEG